MTEDFKLEKSLCTEFSKADSKSYLIRLRENVKWHNGGEFTAEDVKFTIEQIKSLKDSSIYSPNVSNIENIEIINSNLIKLYLNHEEAFFEYNLTFPIISANLFGTESLITSDKNNVPMGTGKYKLQSIDLSTQMELKANQNWWKEENLRIDTITIRIYGTVAEVYNAYKLGGLDLISTQSLNIADTIGTIGVSVKEICGRNFDYIVLNTASANLSDKSIRQTIKSIINREEIISNVYGGKYIKADYPLEYGSYLYEEKNKKYDKIESKARINLVVQSSNEARVKVAELLKKQIEQTRNTSSVNTSKRSDI